jgi:hypothetical protein
MATRSEGVRRLSILGGMLSSLALPAAAWIFEWDEESSAQLLLWMAIFFGLGWALVRMVAWVVDGFREDRRPS